MMTHNKGFGIVEVMVGLVVGLVSMIVIMQVYSTFENQKRSTTTGSDAQTNGAIALYLLEREVRAAGNAINEGRPGLTPPVAGCKTWVYDNSGSFWAPSAGGSTLAPAGATTIRFAPAVATDGGAAGQPDSLTIVYGTSAVTAPFDLMAPYAAGASNISLASNSGINAGDMVVLVQEDGSKKAATVLAGLSYQNNRVPHDCIMLQVGSPVSNPLSIPTGRYNKSGGFTSADNGGAFTADTELYNLGQVNVVTYRIANNNLVADSTKFGVVPNGTVAPGSVTNSTLTLPLAANVVNMQVQYGVDTGNAVTSCPAHAVNSLDPDAIVDSWVDATGATWANDGATTPTVLNLRRIRAVRIGLVARGVVQEKGCSAGNASTWVTTAPPVIHWDSGPDMNPTLTADANWMCYRYKVFQVTVPLRNTIWSATMNPASAASCR